MHCNEVVDTKETKANAVERKLNSRESLKGVVFTFDVFEKGN